MAGICPEVSTSIARKTQALHSSLPISVPESKLSQRCFHRDINSGEIMQASDSEDFGYSKQIKYLHQLLSQAQYGHIGFVEHGHRCPVAMMWSRCNNAGICSVHSSRTRLQSTSQIRSDTHANMSTSPWPPAAGRAAKRPPRWPRRSRACNAATPPAAKNAIAAVHRPDTRSSRYSLPAPR